MKRIFVILVTLFAISFGVAAQQKGEQSIGVYLGYDAGLSRYKFPSSDYQPSKIETVKNTMHFLAALDYSYFVVDNLRLSAMLSYIFEGNRDAKEATRSFSAGLGLAYYVRLAPNFYYTPGLNAGYGIVSRDARLSTNAMKWLSLEGWLAEIQPVALEFRPVKRFSMNVSLCSIQGAALKGGMTGKKLSILGMTFDLIANAQVGLKFWF